MKEKPKNKIAILITLLLLLVAVASTFMGTLAKYVSSNTVSEEARAAKFEFNAPTTISLFSDSYNNVTADEAGKKIVAPGTSGQYEFEVSGTSEVAFMVNVEIVVNYSDEWNGYEPLEFSIDGQTWTDFEQYKDDLAYALTSEVLPPNTPYSSTQTIHWRWPFSVSSENDLKDTLIGKAASEGEFPVVSVSITVIASQIAS